MPPMACAPRLWQVRTRSSVYARMPPLRLPGEVLEFWFSEQSRPLWFEKNAGFDEEVRNRFGANVSAACIGDLDYWVRAVDSSLALVLLLDQFPRNIHRGTLRAFAGDPRARITANTAIERGFDRRTPLDRRFFFYLPFEHGGTRQPDRLPRGGRAA